MNKKTKKAFLIGAGAALAYNAAKGNGIFNIPRFYSQHKAMKKYLETNHSGAVSGDIIKTASGWTCIINDHANKFLLNISKSSDGTYIFSETNM